MNQQQYSVQQASVIEKMSEICAAVEPNEIQPDGIWFKKWDLLITVQIQSLDERSMAVLDFTADCPRFDEPLHETCAGMGSDPAAALGSALGSFLFGLMSAVFTLMRRESTVQLATEFAGKERKWNLIQSEIVGMGEPVPSQEQGDFWNAVRHQLPSVLGSRRLTMIKLYGAKQADGSITAEARVNDVVSPRLSEQLRQQIESWKTTQFSSRKQFLLLEQDPDTADIYPYTKAQIQAWTVQAVRLFQACDDPDKARRYTDILARDLKDAALAEEFSHFLPEFCAENAFPELTLDEAIRFEYAAKSEEVTCHQLTAYAWMKEALYEGFAQEQFDSETFRRYIAVSSLYDLVCQVKQKGEQLKDLRPVKLTLNCSDAYHFQ